MQLFSKLVTADEVAKNSKSVFHATLNAHGLYNTQQFVLRLSPIVHRTLASLPPGIVNNRDIGLEGAQAMSTYLHETTHWWQHIGSTYGFILSLNYPVQSHCTHSHLKSLIHEDGFKKSIFLQSIDLNKRGPIGFGTIASRANTIVNNHFDLLAFRAFTLGPEAAQSVAKHKLFETVGHAFHMTYAQTIAQLASTVDRNFSVLPNPSEWVGEFRSLKEAKVRYHHSDLPVDIWPIGAHEIFEGQAQFAQIQYLSHACGHQLDWDNYRNLGMLRGVYVKAFEAFLHLTESNWPEYINDPLIGLFLLVCDLAINPASGFPATISPNFKTFVDDVNPGARFWMFCRVIANQHPETKNEVQTYSRTEYEAIAQKLCSVLKEASPLLIAKVFSSWFDKSGELSNLRSEFESYSFSSENFVLRHLFAHFLAFQEDKFKHPEFFCWPGAWMAGDRITADVMVLFDKHGALFVDKEHDDGIFPRIQKTRDESRVQSVFNNFYHNQIIYELANQWISEPGAFNYDFGWLAPSRMLEMEEFLRRKFREVFEVDPEEVEVLSPRD